MFSPKNHPTPLERRSQRVSKSSWPQTFVLFASVAAIGIPTAHTAPVTAKKADALVDSIGVNVHLGYDNTVYGNFTMIKTRLQEIGIRHTRDGFENASFKQYIKDRHNDLGRAGIRGTFIAGGGLSPAQCIQSANLLTDSVEALEGQNEILNIYVGWDEAKRQAARQYQIDYFNAINSDSRWNSYPILGPTCVGNNAYQALGDLTAYMDFGNFHPYPLGPAPAVSNSGYFNELNGANYVSPGKQLFATETGYTSGTHDDGNQRVSPAAAGKYAPRLYLENFNRGVLRSFWYELIDQGTDGSQESTFGLIANNFGYKPQGSAIRNLITLLKDASYNTTSLRWESPAFNAGTLDYTLTGNTANVHTTLLQKSNGKFYLCLWQEVNSYDINNSVEADINNPDVGVTLTVATPITSAVAYRPTSGTTGTTLAISGSQITLNVPDQVLIVELTTGGSSIVNGGVYELEPVCAPGKRLDVSGVSAADGANVHIWTDFSASNQRWKAELQADGRYELTPQHASNKRLDVNGASSAEGANVHSWTDNNSPAQRWSIMAQSDGTYELEPACAPGKRLDVNGSGSSDGTNVHSWGDNNSSAQRWRFLLQ